MIFQNNNNNNNNNILIMVVRTSDQFIGDFLSLFRYSVKNLTFALEHVKMDLEGG
jgi:hypothetical protein